LMTKATKVGLVLVEHKHYNAFSEENLRLLDIIGQQVGIAMENVNLYQRLQALANTDSLTGIYNRLYLQERLHAEFEKAQKKGHELSLAILDIDYFKKFNDTYGHLFGDKVIKSIAELLKDSLSGNDIIARYGGEEFVILFMGTGKEEALKKVEDLRQKIAKLIIKDQLVTASVTVSFGLSTYPELAEYEIDLIRSADNALYEAKASGRNCVVLANKKETA
jgi:diguanylate cyclase (GGDEF)-like protein